MKNNKDMFLNIEKFFGRWFLFCFIVICSAPRQPIYSSDSSDDSFDEEKEAKGQKRLMKAKKLDSDEVRKE